MSPRTRIGCTLYEMARATLVRAGPAPRESARRRRASARRYAAAALVVCLGLPVAGCYWPRSSTLPVPRLEHPAFDVATAGLQPPFRFAVFGDQKGLAKSGEWDALLRDLRSLDPPPAFLLDTDISATGTLPINTGGGQISAGQPGLAGGQLNLIEAIRQMLGEAGERQVPDADNAMVTGIGVIPYVRNWGSSAAMILERG